MQGNLRTPVLVPAMSRPNSRKEIRNDCVDIPFYSAGSVPPPGNSEMYHDSSIINVTQTF